MQDTPGQAQARSFFRCRFGNEKKEVEETEEEKKKKEKEKKKNGKPELEPPEMGCVVCKA